jgi:7-carboxy-7-deazaguanine synthase
MIINEIFYSIQGEGLLAGMPSVFIRLAGCPLRCRWCDTKYAQDPSAGVEMSIEQIIDKVQQQQCRYVVLTGGEPVVNPQLPALVKALKKLRKHITIETAGIKFIRGLACDLLSISPKTTDSMYKTKKKTPLRPRSGRADPFFVRRLVDAYPYQLKFVVDSPADLPEILRFIDRLRNVDPAKVMLMPQSRTRDELLAKSPMVAELCKQTGFAFCNRLQILLYNGQRGK